MVRLGSSGFFWVSLGFSGFLNYHPGFLWVRLGFVLFLVCRLFSHFQPIIVSYNTTFLFFIIRQPTHCLCGIFFVVPNFITPGFKDYVYIIRSLRQRQSQPVYLYLLKIQAYHHLYLSHHLILALHYLQSVIRS